MTTINKYGSMLRELMNERTTQARRDEIFRLFDEFSDREEKYKAWTRRQDGKLNTQLIDFPVDVIHNEVLKKDEASLVIFPASIYEIIMIAGSGSITSANGGNIWAQFNGDTGASNYAWQLISGTGGTVGGAEDTSFHAVALGVFGTTGAGAGVNGSFRAEIIHPQGVWKKNVLSHTYTAEFNDLYLLGSTWANTDPIKSIEIFGTDNTLAKGTTNLASGSLFTVYGVK